MSTNYFELLKYAATGIASPSMTHFDRMRASALMGGAVQTLTGIPPLSFKSNGKPLISLSMLGNAQQTGTPSPDNIIMPTFCGVRTGNLWSEDYPNISGTIRYIPIYVGDGSFTLSTTAPYDSSVANLFLLSGNVSTGASTSDNGAWLNHSVTAQSNSGYVTIAYRKYSGTTSPAECKTMLNSGTEPLPYEPYGYKIPITCAGQTVPVYLGQTQTVRKIQKLVLTGNEIITKAASNPVFTMQFSGVNTPISENAVTTLSTHYQAQSNTSGTGNVGDLRVCIRREYSTMYIGDTRYDNAADYKAYLAQQYANGTPVTIWYALATPQTAIVNEPLAKIGDYADELHSTDAGVTIPTARGNNTLTVDTDLQPSSVTIRYKS